MAKPFYITTPIYYVNGTPHIGAGLTTICCDFLARHMRMRGRETYFLTGTDEQATKCLEAAQKAGVSTLDFVTGLAGQFRDAWSAMHCEANDFIRTTEPRHVEVVQEIFRRLKESGDIYSGIYEGWYCVSDETFFRDTDVADDHLCPNAECRKPLQRVQEQNYFFRLSAYGDRLLEHIEANPGFLQPDFRRNEVIAFIKQGLRDMSITRSNPGWGIEVPGEPDKVIYVWFDALINYLAATGWPALGYTDLWPADVHFMAKEIYVRFHATLWPAMLMGLGVELPKVVYAHGWWVEAGGGKLGKRTGGLPHPVAYAREIADLSGASEPVAIDALRYLLLREMVFHNDSEFSHESFIKRYNTDLANDLGNLCNRATNMVVKYFDGVVPQPGEQDAEVATVAADVVREYEVAIGEFRLNAALEAAGKLVAHMNRYIEVRKPWVQAKQGQVAELGQTLYTCLEAVRLVSALLWPAMPVASSELRKRVGIADPDAMPTWDETGWGVLPTGHSIPAPEPLFPRIQDVPEEKKMTETPEPKPVAEPPVAPVAAPEAPAAPEPAYIQYEDFAKVQLRTGKVLTAERIPKADKLLKLTVDLGTETRTICAGIAEMYEPDELVGKLVVVVANLAPRKMRGIESQGMLLAADTEGQAILLQPETPVPPGSIVR